MARPTRLTIAKDDIVSALDDTDLKVFSAGQLAGLLSEKRGFWRLAQRTTTAEFIDFLERQNELKTVEFKSDSYARQIVRYARGDASVYEFAQSLQSKGYLSHGTAVALHGLNDLLPTRLYVNVEQSVKPAPKGGLTQSGIERAFAGEQRQSNMSYTYGDWSVTIINGKHTNALGVEEIKGPSDENLRATDLERTLIDIVVRPAYAGGIFQVLEAYRAARERISTNRLIATLKKLDYIYPYHQAIGFLMERAGYDKKRTQLLRQPGLKYDFYLTHAMKNPDYSDAWRIYYPRGI